MYQPFRLALLPLRTDVHNRARLQLVFHLFLCSFIGAHELMVQDSLFSLRLGFLPAPCLFSDQPEVEAQQAVVQCSSPVKP